LKKAKNYKFGVKKAKVATLSVIMTIAVLLCLATHELLCGGYAVYVN